MRIVIWTVFIALLMFVSIVFIAVEPQIQVEDQKTQLRWRTK